MAKVLATEIRSGHLLEWEKRIWRVIKCYHVHVGGRGGAFMQVEMKDIESGTKTNQRIRTEDKVERAFVDPREMQYLYNDGTGYVFMRSEEHTSELQSRLHLVCRLLLEKKKKQHTENHLHVHTNLLSYC